MFCVTAWRPSAVSSWLGAFTFGGSGNMSQSKAFSWPSDTGGGTDWPGRDPGRRPVVLPALTEDQRRTAHFRELMRPGPIEQARFDADRRKNGPPIMVGLF